MVNSSAYSYIIPDLVHADMLALHINSLKAGHEAYKTVSPALCNVHTCIMQLPTDEVYIHI